MTQKTISLSAKIALYEPDIPQNTAAIIRTCSCFDVMIEIIEPCGFMLNDKRFKRGNWLVSSPNRNLVFILDRETKKIVWSWGVGELDAVHMPRMLDNGNILMLDNGRKRGYSRVIELNPLTKEVVWEYKENPAKNFWCKEIGSAQELPNGNILIADGYNGRAFEITRQGEKVWEWFNPKFNKEGRRATFYRMLRHSKEKIEKLI